LKVEATGSINVAGNIRITGPDTTFQGGNAAAMVMSNRYKGEQSSQMRLAPFLASALTAFLKTATLEMLRPKDLVSPQRFQQPTDQKINFDWNFFTSEGIPSFTYNDFAFISLTGPDDTATAMEQLLLEVESANFMVEPLADTKFSKAPEGTSNPAPELLVLQIQDSTQKLEFRHFL
jgi:hypothetical protein